MKKNTVSQKMIDPHDDDFGLMMNCAVRYAIGRMTYMPYAVISFIRPYLHELTDRTLTVMIRDIQEHGEFPIPENEYDRKRRYGMECDYHDWMKFLEELKAEDNRRKQV